MELRTNIYLFLWEFTNFRDDHVAITTSLDTKHLMNRKFLAQKPSAKLGVII